MLQFACSALSSRAPFFAFGCACGPQADDDADVVLVDEAIEMASDLIMLLSGGRVFGICTKTVHPVGGGGACGPMGGGPYGYPHGPSYGYGFNNTFDGMDLIPLRGPNTEVVSVNINGSNLASSAYRLVDDRYLLRVDGSSWPSANSPDPTNTNYWTVTYRFGRPPDKITRDAVDELACELIKDYSQRQSNLPRGAKNLNIQGASVALEDATEALASGGDNLPAVARFLGMYNPENYRDVIGVWSPELSRGWELYESEGPSGS